MPVIAVTISALRVASRGLSVSLFHSRTWEQQSSTISEAPFMRITFLPAPGPSFGCQLTSVVILFLFEVKGSLIMGWSVPSR